MDLNKLSVFIEVVNAGSFTKAALVLKQPKSRISRIISSLELELGVPLIYRTTRQFKLSLKGQELYTRVAPHLQGLKAAVDLVSADSDELTGPIRMTAPEDLASELLSPMCAEFLDLHPKLRLSIVASNSLLDLVKDSIDVSIRFGRSRDSTMLQKKIGSVEMIFVMAPGLVSIHQPKKLDQIESLPYLHFEGSAQRPHMIKVVSSKESRMIKHKAIFESGNFLVLRSMAIEGAGVTLLPSFLAQGPLSRGELVHVFKDWKTEGIPVQILLPHQKEVPRKIRKFVDFLAPKLTKFFN